MNGHLQYDPPPTRSAIGRPRNALLLGAVVGLAVVLAGAGSLQWHGAATGTFEAAPEEGCVDAEDIVVDEQAGLCYDIPAGWARAGETDLQEYPENSGQSDGATYTSGLVADPSQGIVVYVSPDGHAMYAYDGMSLEQVTEGLASRTIEAYSAQAVQVETRTISIDGFEAVTSTASVPFPQELSESGEPVAGWARATMVDLGEGYGASFVYSGLVVTESDLLHGDGRVAEMNAVHDSISVIQEAAPGEGSDAPDEPSDPESA